MLQRLGNASTRFTQRFIPNPFIFAIILTLVTAILAILLTPTTPTQIVGYWYGGFWNLLTFSMQMVVILLFGYVLASSPIVNRFIERMAELPKSAGSAIVLITLLAAIFGFISWGLGLIVGAISARKVCESCKRRGIKVHFPLAAAAGFTGLIIFNCGLSASAPLLVNTEGHFLQEQLGLIPLSETIFSPANLVTFLLFCAVIPFLYAAMQPKEDERELIEDGGNFQLSDGGSAELTSLNKEGDKTFAARMENSIILSAIVVLTGFGYIIWHFWTNGFDLNLNFVNFTLLICGMAAYKTPIAYVRAIDQGITACGQIVLQFPFYAGIMGIMSSSGLIAVLANSMVSISSATSLPFWSFVSAAVVNLFVPSAGGQWAVQGPVLIDAAQQLNADMGLVVVAFGYGDQLTNGLQPMWMLPLLGVTGLKAGQVLGYTAVMMLVGFVIFGLGVTLIPAIL